MDTKIGSSWIPVRDWEKTGLPYPRKNQWQGLLRNRFKNGLVEFECIAKTDRLVLVHPVRLQRWIESKVETSASAPR